MRRVVNSAAPLSRDPPETAVATAGRLVEIFSNGHDASKALRIRGLPVYIKEGEQRFGEVGSRRPQPLVLH